MKLCSCCKVSKPVFEFCKDKSRKDGLNHRCRSCANLKIALYRETHRDELLAYSRNYDRTRRKEFRAQYLIDNAEHIKLWSMQYRELNKYKINAKGRKWGKNNPHKVAAKNLRRYTSLEQATPAWANIDRIYEIYLERDRLIDVTGSKHHVDHIIPLIHPLVCGLHVEFNLQILTAAENCKKSNKFVPGFLPHNLSPFS